MTWNWRQENWPEFQYDTSKLADMENRFLLSAGILSGALKHIDEMERQLITIDLMSTEAMKTSEIEGEFLNRDSVQSSIRRNFGLQNTDDNAPPAEAGVAAMMVDLYRTFQDQLKHSTLFNWHGLLMQGRNDLDQIGAYRAHNEAMQIISGQYDSLKVHFEAPPSFLMQAEMGSFIKWFNKTAPDGSNPLPALTRAGIAHLYFVSIHPFEDGNGRIGRAISEKALSQCLGAPTLIALSMTIENARRYYYKALEQNNKEMEITDWLVYFAETIIDAQRYSQSCIDFLIHKTRLYDRIRNTLNERQSDVLAHMFDLGPEGIREGINAETYLSITHTSRATATRDLQDLVQKDVLYRLGERKHTRYYLNMPSASTS